MGWQNELDKVMAGSGGGIRQGVVDGFGDVFRVSRKQGNLKSEGDVLRGSAKWGSGDFVQVIVNLFIYFSMGRAILNDPQMAWPL